MCRSVNVSTCSCWVNNVFGWWGAPVWVTFRLFCIIYKLIGQINETLTDVDIHLSLSLSLSLYVLHTQREREREMLFPKCTNHYNNVLCHQYCLRKINQYPIHNFSTLFLHWTFFLDYSVTVLCFYILNDKLWQTVT